MGLCVSNQEKVTKRYAHMLMFFCVNASKLMKGFFVSNKLPGVLSQDIAELSAAVGARHAGEHVNIVGGTRHIRTMRRISADSAQATLV